MAVFFRKYLVITTEKFGPSLSRIGNLNHLSMDFVSRSLSFAKIDGSSQFFIYCVVALLKIRSGDLSVQMKRLFISDESLSMDWS